MFLYWSKWKNSSVGYSKGSECYFFPSKMFLYEVLYKKTFFLLKLQQNWTYCFKALVELKPRPNPFPSYQCKVKVCLNVSLPRTAQGPLTCLRSSRAAPCHSLLFCLSPTWLPQDAGAGLFYTMLPAQGTISAPGIFGWLSLEWAMARLHQVGRSKKRCWSRSFSGECSMGFPPAVPCVTCTSLLWSLPAPPVTALMHFTSQKLHKQMLVPLYCLYAAQIFQAKGRPDGATASLDLQGPACQV